MEPISMISSAVGLGMNVYNMIEQRKAQKEQEALAQRQEYMNNQSADMAELSSFKSSMGGTTMFALGGEDSSNISFYPGEIPISKGVKLLQGMPHEFGGINKMRMTNTGLHEDQVEAEGGEVELATNAGNMMLSNRLAPADGLYSSYAEKGLKVGLEKSKYDKSNDQFSRNATNRLSKGLKGIFDEQELQKQSMNQENQGMQMAYGGPDIPPVTITGTSNYLGRRDPMEQLATTLNGELDDIDRYRPWDADFYNNDVINPINNNVTYSRKALLVPNKYPNVGQGNFGTSRVPTPKPNNKSYGKHSPIGNSVNNFVQAGKYQYMIDGNNQYNGTDVSDGGAGWSFTGNPFKSVRDGAPGWQKFKGQVGQLPSQLKYFNDKYLQEDNAEGQWIPDLTGGDYALVGMNTLSQGVAAYAHSQAKPVATPMMKAALINPNYRNDADRSQLNRDYAKTVSDLANKGTDLSRMSSTLAAVGANKNAAMGQLSEDEYNKTLANHRLNAQMANQVMMQNQQVQMQNLRDAQEHKLDTISNYGKVATDTLSNIAALRNEQRRIDQVNAELDIAASDTNPNIAAWNVMNKYKDDPEGYKAEITALFGGDEEAIEHFMTQYNRKYKIKSPYTGPTSTIESPSISLSGNSNSSLMPSNSGISLSGNKTLPFYNANARRLNSMLFNR